MLPKGEVLSGAVAFRKRNRVNGSTGSNRVIRGGSWNNDADNCRVANRNWNNPDNRNNNVGFRPANTAPFEWFVFYGNKRVNVLSRRWSCSRYETGTNSRLPPSV